MPLYKGTLGRKLTAPEVDGNFRELFDLITALQNDRPQPNGIASIQVVSGRMIINLVDGTILGPFTLPVLSFRWRGAWSPYTLFDSLDTFVVDGVGLFSVMTPHTSGALFVPDLVIGASDLAYRKIFGFAPDGGASIIYDMEFQYQGVLADATIAPINFVALRPFLLPILGNKARLVSPASVADQVLPILHGTTPIGTATFLVGARLGAIALSADESFPEDDEFIVGLPGTPDPTAAGMTLAFAARRIIA